MSKWPVFSEEDRAGRIGVNLVGLKITKLLKWVFRETSSSDLGIDGEIELREDDQTSHGRLISVQIKCGTSFLSEKTPSGYIYRGDPKHLQYWTEHTTPVVVILCDPDKEKCWWQVVDLQIVSLHEKGWSLEVPFKNELSADGAVALREVANRLQKKDLVELLFRDWLGWSFEHRLKLASEYAVPRDYHWLTFLGALGDDEFVMTDYVMSAGNQGFRDTEVQEMLRWAENNHKAYGYRRFLLAFISESPQLLEQIPSPKLIHGVVVDFVPLLIDFRGPPSLCEVGKDGQLIQFYEQGEPLNAWGAHVERNIRRAGP